MKYTTAIAAAMVLALASVGPAMAQANFNVAMMPDHSVSSSKLIGQKVYDEQGTGIGTVVDVMLKDKAEPSVVLSVGDFLGGGKKMVIVPLSHVHLDTAKAMMPGATKPALKAMPTYSYGFGGGGGG